MLTWIKRGIWLYLGFLSINIMYITYLNRSFLVTIEDMVKYLVWKRIKMTKQNKTTHFWILQIQFWVDQFWFVLTAVPFNPEWNSQLLITKNHTLGFLFPFLYFHNFNGGFKYGFFLSRFYFKGTDNSRGMFMYWSHVGAAQDMKLLNKGSTEDLGFISQLTCILI